jgi:hypothetical protein
MLVKVLISLHKEVKDVSESFYFSLQTKQVISK